MIGVTGEAADEVLEARARHRGQLRRRPSAPRAADAPAQRVLSPNTSQGPSAGGLPEARPRRARQRAHAPAPAAAPPSPAAARSPPRASPPSPPSSPARARSSRPAQLRAALIAAADPPDLPARPRRRRAAARADASPGVTADPPTAVSGALDPVSVELSAAASRRRSRCAPTDGATVAPQHAHAAPGRADRRSPSACPSPARRIGRLEALDPAGKVVASVPWLVRPDRSSRSRVGRAARSPRRPPRALHARRRSSAARRPQIQVAERLILDLVDAKRQRPRAASRSRGGARELMPAEYAYTLPRGALPAGATRSAPAPGRRARSEPTERRSTLRPVMTVTLYSRPGCHLCDEAREALERVTRAGAVHARRGRHRDRRRAARALSRADPGRRARRRGAVRLLRGRGGPVAAHSLS